MKTLGVALAVLAAAGCAPNVIWSGHTADRRHTIEILRDRSGGAEWVVVDGKHREPFTSIAAWSLETIRDRIVYAATRGGKWIVVDDGRAGSPWDGIGELVLASRRTAYAAERDKRWYVVIDGKAGAPWNAILAGTLRFSRDAGRVAYVAQDRAGVHVVVDGVASAAWDGVAQLVISDDGAHVAYVGRHGTEATVVVDGVAGAAYRSIKHLALANGTAIYAAETDDGWHIVRGTETTASVHDIRAVVVLGAHAAWLARDDGGDVVMCDGTIVGRAPSIVDDRIAILDDCNVAFVARDKRAFRLVTRDTDVAYQEVGKLIVGPDSKLAYAARRGATWDVIVGGRTYAGGEFAGEPALSPDGTRVAFIVSRGKRWYAVVDGRAYAFDFVLDGSLAFSRDGRHWSAIAGDVRRKHLFFVVDGERASRLAPVEVYSAMSRPGDPLMTDRGSLLRDWAAAEADKR